MNQTSSLSWSEAFKKGPGPETPAEATILFSKGICMGSADVVPGVSGGTIALITGIYEDLLNAVKSFDTVFFKRLLRLDLKGALATVHSRFITFLLAGIAVAFISIAHVMHYLLTHHAILTWSLFFGLIAASILVVGGKVGSWKGLTALFFLGGTLAAWLFVGLIPVNTPEQWWFIFFSGFVAICAMVLPGLSGSFLLLILGKYEFIMGAVKNPLLAENMIVIIFFFSGAIAGLLSFSRILKWLLDRWPALSLAFLTGLMAGSLRKIWPWKETLETALIGDKVRVIREANVLPPDFGLDFLTALLMAVIGFALVMLLERLSRS